MSPSADLPGLATAFDEEAMKGHLQAALLGGASRFTVERSTPTRPLYVPGESCAVRYRVRARDGATGTVIEPIVTGRVFPSGPTCAAYVNEKLAPLAARVRGRPEVAAFAAPAARIGELDMAVHLWPIDADLPTLVDATDPARMIGVLRDVSPEAVEPRAPGEDCRVELVSYRRRQRCVLRYTVSGRDEDAPLVVYGKVTAAADADLTSRAIHAIRRRIGERAAHHRFGLPRPLGARPDLRLLLLEALPGEARIGPALKARLRAPAAPDSPALERMVTTCGFVAALLHSSAVNAGRPRRLDDELAGVQDQIVSVRRFVPAFADRARSSLERIAALAERSEPLKPCLSHGDFKHEQVLFEGVGSGLVDFDGICQAEPALDLGNFVAHLRAAVERIQRHAAVASPVADELVDGFMTAYVKAAGPQVEDERRLRLRTSLYEATSLLRLALRSQHDLDEPRAESMATVLERRLSASARSST